MKNETEWLGGKDLEGDSCGLCECTSQNSPGVTERETMKTSAG